MKLLIITKRFPQKKMKKRTRNLKLFHKHWKVNKIKLIKYRTLTKKSKMLPLNKIEVSQLAPSLYHLLLINLELLPLKSIKRKKSNPTLVQLRFSKKEKEKEKVKTQITLIMMKEACSLIIIILTISRTKRKLSPLLKSSNNITRLLKISKISKTELTIILRILSRIRINLKI